MPLDQFPFGLFQINYRDNGTKLNFPVDSLLSVKYSNTLCMCKSYAPLQSVESYRKAYFEKSFKLVNILADSLLHIKCSDSLCKLFSQCITPKIFMMKFYAAKAKITYYIGLTLSRYFFLVKIIRTVHRKQLHSQCNNIIPGIQAVIIQL